MAKSKVPQLEKPFANRIVGHGEEDVDQLMANPHNFRLHPANQQHALAGAIDDIGFIRSLTVNRTTGAVVDGHLRVTLALRSGVKSLPVEYVELSEAEEAKALLMLDPISAMAAADKDKLAELLRQTQSDDARVTAMLTELAFKEGLQYAQGNGNNDPDENGELADRAEELLLKWPVSNGDAFILGDSRLVCGDCTDSTMIAHALDGATLDLQLTDPPYGISVVKGLRSTIGGSGPVNIGSVCARGTYPFGGINHPRATIGGRRIVDATLYRPVAGDDKPFDPTHLLALPGEKILFGGNCFASKLPDSRCWIAWDKNNTGNFSDVELAWTSFDKGTKLYRWTWNGLVRQGQRNVEDIKRFHPTQKPVGLFEMILQDFSEPGWTVGDFYLGSGTTLIACARTGRKCVAIEQDAAYCAVALERWALVTGLTPRRIE